MPAINLMPRLQTGGCENATQIRAPGSLPAYSFRLLLKASASKSAERNIGRDGGFPVQKLLPLYKIAHDFSSRRAESRFRPKVGQNAPSSLNQTPNFALTHGFAINLQRLIYFFLPKEDIEEEVASLRRHWFMNRKS